MKTYLTPIVIAALLVTVTLTIIGCSAGFRGRIDNPTSANKVTQEKPLAAN